MSATFTADGVIPHLKVVTESGVLLAPVKMVPKSRGTLAMQRRHGNDSLPVPMKRDGKLVFALPGGVEVLA